jgi:hypothetical protein
VFDDGLFQVALRIVSSIFEAYELSHQRILDLLENSYMPCMFMHLQLGAANRPLAVTKPPGWYD